MLETLPEPGYPKIILGESLVIKTDVVGPQPPFQRQTVPGRIWWVVEPESICRVLMVFLLF